MNRSKFILFLKISAAAALLYWLINSKKLDMHSLALLFEKPHLLFAAIALWVFGSVGLVSLRWNFLLKGIDVFVPFSTAIRLNLLGLFFNTAMPGAVGGDLVKAYYCSKHFSVKKTHVLFTIILDRVLGIYGIFSLVFLSQIFSFFSSQQNPPHIWLSGLADMISLGFLGMNLFFLLFFIVPTTWIARNKTLTKLLSILPGETVQAPVPIGSDSNSIKPNLVIRYLYLIKTLLKNMLQSLKMYKKHPKYFFSACFFSCLYQGGFFAFFCFVTSFFTQILPTIFDNSTIYASGILTTALPLTPGGLGVGHAAFDRLFSFVGIDQGANIFNVVSISQLALNLLGFFSYITFKVKKDGVE